MPNNTWSAVGAGNWSVNGNWSLGVAPVLADDVIFDATSVQNCTIDVSPSVNSITFAAAYSGNWTAAGQTMTCTLGFSHDGTGTSNFGNGLTCNGNASTAHIGAGVGAVVAISCVLTMNGTVAMVLDDDKGVYFKTTTLAANAVVTSSGTVATIFSNAGVALTMGVNSSLTLNATTRFWRSNSGALFSFGAGCTLNGTANIDIATSGAGIIVTVPAVTYTGTGSWYVLMSSAVLSGSTLRLSGDLNLGTANLYVFDYSAAVALTRTFTFDASGADITCGTFFHGVRLTVASTLNILFGTGNHTFTVFDGATYDIPTSTTNVSMQSSVISCSGNWSFGSNHTVNPGTSAVAITGNSTITSNGKSFFDLTINSGANTVTCTDALTLAAGGDLTLTTGTLNLNTFNLTVGGDAYVNGVSTLNATASTCSFAGNYTTAVASTVTINAATGYTFTAVTAIVTNGITLPSCTFNDDFTISDTCIITSLIIGVDGITGTFEAGNTFTITLLAAADWNGALATLNAFRSTVPGIQYTLSIPNALTLQYMNPQDSALLGFQITVNDGTSVDSGNNDVNWIWPIPVPPTGGGRSQKPSRCWAGVGVGI